MQNASRAQFSLGCLAALPKRPVPDGTTLCLQGLNIAPALISIAPTKNVVNPVGPLAITDTLISATVPALPGP